MTINVSPWPIYPSRLSSVQNEAPGLSEIARRISGNTATMVGHATGADRIVDIGNPAPLNPSGDRGHDHSGGDFGRALLRTITTWQFGRRDEFTSPGLADDTAFMHIAFPADAGGVTSIFDHPITLPFWVPPCQPGAAYDNLGISAVVRVTSASGTAGDTITLRITNRHPGVQIATVVASSPTATLPSVGANAVANTHLESGATSRMRVLPGAVNVLVTRWSLIRVAGGGLRAAQIRLVELELGVYVT